MAPGSFRRGFVALVAMLLSASSVAAAETPKRGGVLRVGNLGEPPALDAHWTTASITETLTNHVYQGLYSLDASNRPMGVERGAVAEVAHARSEEHTAELQS